MYAGEMYSRMKMNKDKYGFYNGTIWFCKSFKLILPAFGVVFYAHWHVGWHDNCDPHAPYRRLRLVKLFGVKLPLKYYTS